MKVAEILKLLRGAPAGAGVGTEAAAPAMAPDVAASALASLDAERGNVQASIEAALAARQQLLLTPGSNRKLSENDALLDELQIELERLNAVEPLLVEAARTAAFSDRRARLTELAAGYAAAIRDLAATLRTAKHQRDRMVQLRDHAVGAGFENDLPYFDLPPPQVALTAAAIDEFEAGSLAHLAHATAKPEPPARFVITITVATGPYRTGEQVGFPAAEAWKWVKAGVAAWAAGQRIPPVPPPEDDATIGGAAA